MVGKHIDVVRQQRGQALPHPTGDPPIRALPKQTVVDQYGVRLRSDCSLNQGQTGRHAGYQLPDLLLALNLQAIGSVVFKPFRLQKFIQGAVKLVSVSHGAVVNKRLPKVGLARALSLSWGRGAPRCCRIPALPQSTAVHTKPASLPAVGPANRRGAAKRPAPPQGAQ